MAAPIGAFLAGWCRGGEVALAGTFGRDLGVFRTRYAASLYFPGIFGVNFVEPQLRKATREGGGLKFRSLTVRELVRILEHFGYEKVRQRGSHMKLKADGRPTISIAYRKDDFPAGTVKKILISDAQLTEDDLREMFD